MIGPSAELLRFALAAALFSPVAVVLPWTLPFVLAAFGALAVVASWDFVRLRRAAPLQAQRILPARAFVGRRVGVEIRVDNPGAEATVVDVIDEVPAVLRVDDPVQRNVDLPAGACWSFTYEVRPETRGDHMLGTLLLLRRSPLGLLERREAWPADVVRAFPDAARLLRAPAATLRQRASVAGSRPTRRRGQGSELDSLRDYVPGDDTRRIVWGPSARRGRPVVRLDRHEQNHHVWIAVDTSRLMGGFVERQTKLDQAIDAAIVLAAGAIGCQDRVGVIAFDSSVHAKLGPHRRRSDLAAFVDLLQPLSARLVEPNYRRLAQNLLTSLGQRALVFVLSDFTETEEDVVVASMGLLAQRHRVVLAGVRDPAFAALEAREPRDEDGLAPYRRIVIGDLLEAREKLVGRLRRAGVDVVDHPAEKISARVLDRYLAIRYGPER